MNQDPHEILKALFRRDLSAFIEKIFTMLAPATPFLRNWHIDAMAHHLWRCYTGEIRRLIITLPPRNLKSVCASVAFPAWVLGQDPSRKIVCVSYSQELASLHARDTREIMESAWYRSIFKETRLSRRRNAEHDFMTTRRGSRFATSVGGTITGRGGSLIIIDDPMKADDALSETRMKFVIKWFNETLITRLDDKRNDVIIIVMQRLHVDDLVGRALETGEWVHLNLPAIAQKEESVAIGSSRFYVRRAGELLHAEREDQAVMDELLRTLGTRGFSAQYLQEPQPPDGTIIHLSWFKRYEQLPPREPGDEIIQSWDTAFKTGITNDYSCCTTWLLKGKQSYLMDVYRSRLDYPSLRRKLIEHAAHWNADSLVVEDSASGQALLQELEFRPKGATWWVNGVKPTDDKVARAEIEAVPIEAGLVYLPQQAPWLEDLCAEIRTFPRSNHDDQVDSLSQYLHWIRTRFVPPKGLIEVVWPT